ncbi:hypothetical protein J4Q44_G00083730 [Coregonus suidteri]|uniref:RNA-binding protein 15 n=1 Tax=Coregonus suidteri TaxID=861788 RepID=A0AAN8RBZ3_9TELE
MKGKERSPVKKRSRILEDIRDRGGSHPTSKKIGALSAGSSNNGNSSVKSGGSVRRSLPSEKRDSRDLYCHVSSRTASNHGYPNTTGSSSKLHISLALDPTTRTNSRGELRPLPINESEYKTLKVGELGSQLSDEEIEDGLFHEFKKFGDVSVKISRVNDERVAFVNFRRPENAKAAKHARGKLVLYDRPLKIEAVYMNRRRSRSPIEKDPYVELEREMEFSIYEARARPPFIPDCAAFREEDLLSPEDDQRANRTLFLGNLDVSVTENDLRRAFDRFGVITEVDIKRTAARGQSSTYGFLKFENLDMAHRAKITMEFDRFGTIRTIDYRKGDTWAYIQYESLDAAQAACSHMRGFPLGGPERRLRVDFADTELRYQQHYLQPLPLPPHFDLVADSFVHRPTPEAIRVRERSPPPTLRFRERELYTADWAGPAVRERVRGAAFEPLEHLERRSREPWSLECERELQSRDQVRKRRLLDDGRRPDRSPDSSEHVRRRHGTSLERSPGGSSRDGGRYSPPHSDRPSPGGEQRGSLDCDPGDKRLRTLSPAEPERDRKCKASDSCKSPVKREDRSDPSSRSSLQSKKLCQAWQGVLLLKNSSFPTSMHLLEGDLAVAAGLLVEGSTAAGPSGYSILLAVPGRSEEGLQDVGSSTERPLKNLVSYLKQKQAAGVITLPVGGSRDKDGAGVLHAFPPCDFSQQFLDASAKALAKTEEDYLGMVIVRGAS